MDDVCRMIWETNVTKIIVCVAGANTSNENNRTVFVDNHTGASDVISNISVTEPSMTTPSTSMFDLAPSLALLCSPNHYMSGGSGGLGFGRQEILMWGMRLCGITVFGERCGASVG